VAWGSGGAQAKMKRVKQHQSMEAAWSYLLHLEEETASKAPDATSGEGATDPLWVDESSAAEVSANEQLLHLNDGAKLIIAMVGKPMRGKTFLASKIKGYCEWLGYRVKHVQASEVRQSLFGKSNAQKGNELSDEERLEQRATAQHQALQEVIQWLQKDGQVAIFDANNATKSRRSWVSEYVEANLVDKTQISTIVSHRILWVESQCDEEEVIVRNFKELRQKDPNSHPEYAGMSKEQAVAKFIEHVKLYDKGYEPLDASEQASFMQIRDFGKQVLVNEIHGFLESKLVSFVMNIHTDRRVIILVRHGQSEYNLQDRIGGDPSLTDAGQVFAQRLADEIESKSATGFQSKHDSSNSEAVKGLQFEPKNDLFVWTSNLNRTIETVQHVECRAKVPWGGLAEIDAGVCECMTYKDFKEKLTSQYMKRQRNKATWRYPGGESYMDVKKRLEPVIFELERQRKPVLVCSHRAVLRCLYSYFMGISIERAPFLPLPLHTMIILTPTTSGWSESRITLGPNVGDFGAHEPDIQAAVANEMKAQAKKRRLEKAAKQQEQQKSTSSSA